MTYANNGFTSGSYDASGNVTNDGLQTFTYDATGQQATASGGLSQSYDGDRLRVKKTENSVTTYYLRSTVLGGQVVYEMKWTGVRWDWTRGYVYQGRKMLAIQDSGVFWVHQDPVTKSQRLTNSSGAVVSTIDLDPWGGETAKSSNEAFQPHRYTSYERDANRDDEAMMRRYAGRLMRFSQPDPYGGSYDVGDPQSFNRYSYTQNDPVNFVDPTGLMIMICTPMAGGEGREDCEAFDDDWGGFTPKDGPIIPEPGGKEPEPVNPACTAQLSGNADVDLAARYIYAESSNDVAEMYAIGQVGANRYRANEARFGNQNWANVWARLSIADDRQSDGTIGTNMFNQADPAKLANLDPVACQNIKTQPVRLSTQLAYDLIRDWMVSLFSWMECTGS